MKDRDPDNDRRYRRPRAWRNAKRALGGQLAGMMAALETTLGETCPRDVLAAALHHFLSLDRERRVAALFDYFQHEDAEDERHPHAPHAVAGESLPGAERWNSLN